MNGDTQTDAADPLRREGEVFRSWQRMLSNRTPQDPRPVILRSWARSRAAGLDPDSGRLDVERIPEPALRARLEENARFVSVVRPHLERLSHGFAGIPHVAYVVDAEGIVLDAVGTDAEMMRMYGLLPGYDWSERAMGTNGAGTAVASATPVAVLGQEHFLKPLKGFLCTAAPIATPEGRLLGAIDLSTALEHGHPDNLEAVVQAAAAVAREYQDGD